MRRAYTYKPANITAPIHAFQMRPASAELPWTEARKAAYTLTVARNNLAGAEAGYVAACAALGAANRRPAAMRRHWQGQALRSINAARRQVRAYRAALTAAMANPALASDQVSA